MVWSSVQLKIHFRKMTKLWIYWINNKYDFASSLLYSLYFKISLMFLSTLKFIVFTNLKMCFVCLTVFGIHYSMFSMISLYILTWSLHMTVLGYTVTVSSVISLCCLCFLYTDLVTTFDCWCTLCQCSLCFLYTDLVSTLDCVGIHVRCD